MPIVHVIAVATRQRLSERRAGQPGCAHQGNQTANMVGWVTPLAVAAAVAALALLLRWRPGKAVKYRRAKGGREAGLLERWYISRYDTRLCVSRDFPGIGQSATPAHRSRDSHDSGCLANFGFNLQFAAKAPVAVEAVKADLVAIARHLAKRYGVGHTNAMLPDSPPPPPCAPAFPHDCCADR